jgi:hypothetical protein
MSTTKDSYRADPELRARIQAFSPDEPGAVFPFSARLAKENGWSREHARSVTREYLRFVYLAMTAGHPVTPSLAVDEAWHLHLTYTRSYWDELCARVLGAPLHHEPTRGGADEEAKFADWYARTLATYRTAFGEEPPPAIWPQPPTKVDAPPAAPARVARKGGGPGLFAGVLLAAVLAGASMGLAGVDAFIGMGVLVAVGLFTMYTVQQRGRISGRLRAGGGGAGGAGYGGWDGGDGGGHHGHGAGGDHGGCGGHSGCGHGGCGHGGCGGSGCGGSGCGGGGCGH